MRCSDWAYGCKQTAPFRSTNEQKSVPLVFLEQNIPVKISWQKKGVFMAAFHHTGVNFKYVILIHSFFAIIFNKI